MKILLTGSSGRIGKPISRALAAAGHDVVPFDLEHGHDVLAATAVASAARGVDAIVHTAGVPDDDADWALAPRTMPVNLIGTWNVLLAAREHGIRRVVHLSSGKALGMLERDPDYLPVDDDHPGLPSQPYALSKWLAEEMCEAFTRETSIATVCLRLVLVLDEARYPLLASGSELPPAPGARSWHLGVWVDVDDVVSAVAAAIDCRDPGHARVLICADDVGSERTTADLVAEHLPGVPWRGQPLAQCSRRALADNSRAREVLGWAPAKTWPDRRAVLAALAAP